MKVYHHYKGGLYVLISDEAIDATNDADPTAPPFVVYQNVASGKVFVRRRPEFFDEAEVAVEPLRTSDGFAIKRVPRFLPLFKLPARRGTKEDIS